MKCPFCEALETKVIDSRLNQPRDIIRRRRTCFSCERRFTTYERVEELVPVVIKKDGRRESFDRKKLILGIQKACQKRPVGSEKIEVLVQAVEDHLQGIGVKEVNAQEIGRFVMSGLSQLDKVAYVRFASVYRDFKTIDEFFTDLQTLDLEGERLKFSIPFKVEE